ncbi:hypothetical protein [Cereibacter sphaeroides]|jgi:hypothetical protein|uniref:hypothetical protein n=1 Tax=Cereibacter sphaeroides TaxID=1063 RepID=UPI0002ECDE40
MATVTLKMPKWRVRVFIAAAWLLAPFIRSEAMGERIVAAMGEWVLRGVRCYDGDRRIG